MIDQNELAIRQIMEARVTAWADAKASAKLERERDERRRRILISELKIEWYRYERAKARVTRQFGGNGTHAL